MSKACTICAGKLVYGNPEKKCFRCNGSGAVVEDWEEPRDPPFDLIRATAYRLGYAVATHGSLMRDFDIMAIPWTSDAVHCRSLIKELCEVLNAKVIDRASKPHGRYAFNLQMDGYIKLIDISVMPTLREVPNFPHHFKRGERVDDR
jgi:hypothetical protein